MRNQKIFLASIFFLSFAVYFYFGFVHLSEFVTADEHFWVNSRIVKYWNGMLHGNWGHTHINDKPGVTLALISGTNILQQKILKSFGLPAGVSMIEDKVEKEQTELRNFRIPILFFNGFFCLYFFWIIKKITRNTWVAVWSFILILLSPVLLGISQIINPDSFLWTFSTATILTFVAALNFPEKKYVFLTALFLALALLCKYSATILYPFLFAVSIFYYLSNLQVWNEKKETAKNIFRISIGYFLIVIGSVVFFALLMPAAIVKPVYLFEGTIGYKSVKFIMLGIGVLQFLVLADAKFFASRFFQKIFLKFSAFLPKIIKFLPIVMFLIFFLALFNWNSSSSILNLINVVDSEYNQKFAPSANFLSKFFYQFYFLIFASTPLVLLAAMFVWAKKIFKDIANNFLLDSLSAFLLVYYVALIFAGLPASVRYSIVLYPILAIIAALGISEFFAIKKFDKIPKIYISLLVIFLSAMSLWMTKPFYFNYANEILPKKYAVSYAWGYGGYEAAQFLNSLPNAENLNVWTDYYGFDVFFRGKTHTNPIIGKNAARIDYYVLTYKGLLMYDYWCEKTVAKCYQKYVPAWKYYSAADPVWSLEIDGRPRNFVKIFKNSD